MATEFFGFPAPMNARPAASIKISRRPITAFIPAVAAVLGVLGLAACANDPIPKDADVIVVGAGIAGLAAAIEAGAAGARVTVVEMSSVGGGHAVRAGGFALVDTDLQRRKGLRDDPDTAYADLMAWGEDADPYWTRYYADQSGPLVYDWLTQLGVEFAIVLDTPEDTVPRFHFTRGTAINVVIPMLRRAITSPNISFAWNSKALELGQTADGLIRVIISNQRSGERKKLTAGALVLATGGFQSNLEMVRRNWRDDLPHPERLLIGSAKSASGSGVRLGEASGAALTRMDHQVTFINGLADPREPARGLKTENPRAIWVNADGKRFVNEAGTSKIKEFAVLTQSPQTHWLIFDADGRKRLIIRGAAWLDRNTIEAEILGNNKLVARADTVPDLADAAGLPADTLSATVNRFNEFSAHGADPHYGRFANPRSKPFTLSKPPYYAIQLLPMTRKSMGGLKINEFAQVVDRNDKPINGLHAAGELTGVAGISGSHGGSGTFLGPSVLLGRIAGRSASGNLQQLTGSEDRSTPPAAEENLPQASGGPDTSPDEGRQAMTFSGKQLAELLADQRAGYWHFETSHALVLEKSLQCTECHSAIWPTGPAATETQRLTQLDSCTVCH
jgi:predicted oxidoreductase